MIKLFRSVYYNHMRAAVGLSKSVEASVINRAKFLIRGRGPDTRAQSHDIITRID